MVVSTHCEKDQNVALGLGGVNLENGSNRSMEVVGFGLGSIIYVDRMCSARD